MATVPFVVTRYHDIASTFADHESYSAAAAQLPLVELDPEARQILLDGGHRPQPSMVPATAMFSFIGVPEHDYARLKAWCGYRAKLAWGRPEADEQVDH